MIRSVLILLLLLLLPVLGHAQVDGMEALTVSEGDNGQSISVSLQALLFMTVLTLLPAILLTMTSFTRIVIVLGILRQAIGTQQTPSNQVLVGLAFFLSLFIMTPVLEDIYSEAVQPYLDEDMNAVEAVTTAREPVRDFMSGQTRDEDLAMFMRIADREQVESIDQVPFTVLVPAFLTSELKTGFQIGFILYLPFLVVDLVVASVLMSMGMLMLSPMIISLPFKIMLFVLVDGWSLIMGTMAQSFS